MAEPAYAPASVRNSQPILDVLADEIGDCERLLEIGSGTGYHAVTFGREFSTLEWQTSDLVENHAYISAAIHESGLGNVLHPIPLDVRDANSAGLRDESYDAVYTSNTAHIMSIDAVHGMLQLAGRVLRFGGRFLAYGPFKREGHFNTASNAAFDASLRARDAAMGLRDLEYIDHLASQLAMERRRVYAMPANNLLVVWQKQEGDR